MSCPLCKVWEREPENVLWQDRVHAIVRTKDLKGHRERVMIVTKKHIKETHDVRTPLYNIVKEAPRIFGYTYKAVVMEGTYGSQPQHWHLVMTDLDPNSEDFEQILGTPWIFVVNIKKWKEDEETKRRKR